MAGRLAAHVEQADPDPLDVAHTLLASRASLPHRAVVVGKDASELVEGLDALAQGTEHPRLARGKAAPRSKLAFVFPGQGSQWAQMAAGLLDESSVFAESIERCEAALAPHVDFSLTETLRDQEGAWLERIEVVQPALFAVMVSLAELWGSFGVKPSAVIGHSQGEIAAAVVAGALSLEDGAKVAALRAKALISLMGEGEMASFALSPTELEPLIAPYGERVAIAAHNGPRSTVCSGEPEALKELVDACEERGTRARLIPVGYASHCAQIERIEAELLEAIADVEPRQAEIPIHSTLLGEPIQGTELTPDYWYRNLREPVRFHEASERLIAEGHTAFLEISSHPVLTLALTETVEANVEDPSRIAVLHSLRREEGDLARFLTSLGQAHSEGVEVDLASLTKAGTLTELPTYPFQRQRYWLEAKAGAGDPSGLGQSATEHPLLGASISLASEGSHLFTGRISQKTHAWIADHAVAGNVLLPGTAFAELALRAGREIGAERLEELVLEAPLILPEEGATQLQLSVCPQEADPERFALEIHSRPEAQDEDQEGERPWTRHASGTLAAQTEPLRLGFDPTSWPPPGAEPIDTEAFYDLLAAAGIEYGPAFQGMEAAWRLGEEIYAEVSLAEEQRGEAERFAVHPALLDAAGHPAFLGGEPGDAVRLPFSFAGVSVGEGRGAAALRLRLRFEGERASLDAASVQGVPSFAIDSLLLRSVDPAGLPAAAVREENLFELRWEEVPPLADAEEGVTEVHRVQTDDDGDAASRAHLLTARALDAIKSFLADEEDAGKRLAIVTEGAVAVDEGEAPDPAAAAVWGLVRTAQTEHPGRFLLVDSDGSAASETALPLALASGGEPQLALRDGSATAPRLFAAGDPADPASAPVRPGRDDPDHRRARRSRRDRGPPACRRSRRRAPSACRPPRCRDARGERADSRAGGARLRGRSGRLRRLRARPGRGAARRASVGSTADRRRALRGGARGRRARDARARAARPGPGAEGRRGLAPARADEGRRFAGARALLLDRGNRRRAGPGELLRRQRLPRRPRLPPARRGPAGDLDRLGPLARAERDDRRPGRCRRRAAPSRRHGAPRHRGSAAAARQLPGRRRAIPGGGFARPARARGRRSGRRPAAAAFRPRPTRSSPGGRRRRSRSPTRDPPCR